jgi:hypothetical protein
MISVSDIYYSQLVVAFDMKFVFMLWVQFEYLYSQRRQLFIHCFRNSFLLSFAFHQS